MGILCTKLVSFTRLFKDARSTEQKEKNSQYLHLNFPFYTLKMLQVFFTAVWQFLLSY
jgi:hypothetical protein